MNDSIIKFVLIAVIVVAFFMLLIMHFPQHKQVFYWGGGLIFSGIVITFLSYFIQLNQEQIKQKLSFKTEIQKQRFQKIVEKWQHYADLEESIAEMMYYYNELADIFGPWEEDDPNRHRSDQLVKYMDELAQKFPKKIEAEIKLISIKSQLLLWSDSSTLNPVDSYGKLLIEFLEKYESYNWEDEAYMADSVGGIENQPVYKELLELNKKRLLSFQNADKIFESLTTEFK